MISQIVSDAGPLIALSRIDRLALLPNLFGVVVAPEVVLRELRLQEPRPGVAPLAEAVRAGVWLRSMTPSDDRAIPGLGVGESAAIRLAQQVHGPLLIDERRGRAIARNRGIAVIGTGRFLIAAKERGLIESIAGSLNALREAGYRLSDELRSRLLAIADEAGPQDVRANR